MELSQLPEKNNVLWVESVADHELSNAQGMLMDYFFHCIQWLLIYIISSFTCHSLLLMLVPLFFCFCLVFVIWSCGFNLFESKHCYFNHKYVLIPFLFNCPQLHLPFLSFFLSISFFFLLFFFSAVISSLFIFQASSPHATSFSPHVHDLGRFCPV